MLKIASIFFCFLVTINLSMACTDFSGKYQYSDSPNGQVDYEYVQSGCDTIKYIAKDVEYDINQDFQLIITMEFGNSIIEIFQKIDFVGPSMINHFRVDTTTDGKVDVQNVIIKNSKLANGDLLLEGIYEDGSTKTAIDKIIK